MAQAAVACNAKIAAAVVAGQVYSR